MQKKLHFLLIFFRNRNEEKKRFLRYSSLFLIIGMQKTLHDNWSVLSKDAKTLEKSLISVFENQTENLLVASRFGIFVRHYGSGIFNETLREHFPLETTKAVFLLDSCLFTLIKKTAEEEKKSSDGFSLSVVMPSSSRLPRTWKAGCARAGRHCLIVCETFMPSLSLGTRESFQG